jgi:nucleotide-binding universal stress UspA family protein
MEQLMADIVVGYDGSAGAQAALALALDAARALEDRVVVAFGFRDPLVGGENADLIAALQELGRSRLAEAAARAREAGIEVEQVVIAEDPAHALADLAVQRQARLIVVGTRGEHPLRGALLGSTPHKLLQITRTPVLVVPAVT